MPYSEGMTETLTRWIDSDDETVIRLGRVRGLFQQLRDTELARGISDEHLINQLVNLAMVHGDPDLAEWHELLQKSVSSWERTFGQQDSHLLINSLDPFTRSCSAARYQQAKLDDLCCQILLQIRPAKRGESWFCSETEIRQLLDLALNAD